MSPLALRISTGKKRAHTLAKSAPACCWISAAPHVIIGHSERRQYFGETDDIVNFKLKAALDAGLRPIVCVGEVLEEREANLTEDVLRRQCLRAFHAISGKKAAKLVVAYEPVWAIGTGKTATPQLAAAAHLLIRGEAAKAFGEEFSKDLRILYGGSVKPENVKASHGGGRNRRRIGRRRKPGPEIVCRNREVLRECRIIRINENEKRENFRL